MLVSKLSFQKDELIKCVLTSLLHYISIRLIFYCEDDIKNEENLWRTRICFLNGSIISVIITMTKLQTKI